MELNDNITVNVDDLLKVDSIYDYLDVNKAFVFGLNLMNILNIPEVAKKYGDELVELETYAKSKADELANAEDSLKENATLGDLTNAVLATATEEIDKVKLAIIMGLYVKECS